MCRSDVLRGASWELSQADNSRCVTQCIQLLHTSMTSTESLLCVQVHEGRKCLPLQRTCPQTR